jgi:hypothetical protein
LQPFEISTLTTKLQLGSLEDIYRARRDHRRTDTVSTTEHNYSEFASYVLHLWEFIDRSLGAAGVVGADYWMSIRQNCCRMEICGITNPNFSDVGTP